MQHEERMSTPQEFVTALVSVQRASEIPQEDDIFGWLIGSWEIDAVLHDGDGRTRTIKGEVHASWVLEGRAIQDLFIFPRRTERHSGAPVQSDRYGTTIRTYDGKLRAWCVNFINPASEETSAQLVARRSGDDIEMEGKLSDGTAIRWRYQEITPNSFHYGAERLQSDGKSWQVYLELFGKRNRSLSQAA
jgi:hypothetical protein